jgi:hypothetical protein
MISHIELGQIPSTSEVQQLIIPIAFLTCISYHAKAWPQRTEHAVMGVGLEGNTQLAQPRVVAALG